MKSYFSTTYKFNQFLNNARVIAKTICAYFLIISTTLSTSVNSFANISATGSTSIDKSANNVPVVNIVNPNSAGVSHNKFTDFNVDPKGVIINNSRADVNSELGGVVLSNSNLKSEANLIINEVISSNSSNIFGATEIVGKSADYILANPNGIRINGAEFININNVTLTTGNVMLGDKGDLSKLVVEQGLIEIFDKHINVRDLSYFDIISKTVMLKSKLHANNNVRIIAGKNTYDYNKKEVISSQGSQDNHISIDSTALGGLYAGKISIISTEKGCGVNLPDLESKIDNLEVTADGKIIHKKLKSAKNCNIKSQSDGVKIEAGQNVISSGDINISTNKDIEIATGSNIEANKSLILNSSKGTITNQGTLQSKGYQGMAIKGAEFINEGQINTDKGSLQIEADRATNRKSIVSGSRLVANIKNDFDNYGSLKSTDNMELIVNGKLSNYSRASINTPDNLSIKAGTLINNNIIIAQKSLDVRANNNIINNGSLVSYAITLDATNGDITNNNIIKAAHKINIDSWHGDITNNALIEANGDISIKAHKGSYIQNNKIDNHGILSKNSDIIIGANNNIIINGGTIDSGNIISLTAKGLIENNGGNITSKHTIELSGDKGILNADQISSRNVSITSGDFFENKGLVSSTGELKINNKNTLTNTGVLQSKGRLEINSEGKLINHNVIYTRDNLIITLQGYLINNPMSSIIAENDVTINAAQGRVVNHGAISTISGAADIKTKNGYFAKGGYLWGGKKLDIKAEQGSIEAEEGSKILTTGQLTIQADSIKINKSLLEAAIANIESLKGSFTTDSSRLIVSDKIRIIANNIDANSIISSGNKLQLDATSTAKFGSSSEVKATQELSITAGSNIENNGYIQFNSGSITSNNEQIINNGNILSFDSLSLKSAKGISVTNTGVINSKDLHLNTDGGLINHGDININEKLNIIKASQIQNYKNITFGTLTSDNAYKLPEYKGENGSILEGGNFNLRIGSFKFTGGEVKINNLLDTQFDSADLGVLEVKGGDGKLKISGALNNSKNLSFDGSSFKLDLNSLANSGVIKGDNLTVIVAGNATNSGTIFGRKNLSITAPTISNNSGAITSSGALTLNASSSLNNTGSIVSTGDGSITAGIISNNNKINSRGKLSLKGSVNNTGELAGLSSLSINGSLKNSSSGRIVSGDTYNSGSININNAGDFINDGRITSYGTASISAASLTNNNIIEARNDLTISASGDVINNHSIYAGSIKKITANNIINNSRIISMNDMTLSATNDVVNKNIIQLLSRGTITIKANNIINKREGVQVDRLDINDLKQHLREFDNNFDSLDADTFTSKFGQNDYSSKESKANPNVASSRHVYQEFFKYYSFYDKFIYKGKPAPTIISNGSIILDAATNINNRGAKISATKDISANGKKLDNKDITLEQYDFEYMKQIIYSAVYKKKGKIKEFHGKKWHVESKWSEYTFNHTATSTLSEPHHRISSIIEAGGKITGSLADQVTNGSISSGGGKPISNGSNSSAASLQASVISSVSEPHAPKVAGATNKTIASKPVEKPLEKAPTPPGEQTPKDSTMSLGSVGLAIKYKKTSKIGEIKMDDSDINKLVQDIESKYKDNRAPPFKSASEYQLPESVNQDIEVKQVLESANWSSPPPPGRYYIKETSHVFTEFSSYFSTENFAQRTNGTYNPKHHNIPQNQQAIHLGDSIKQAEFVLRQHQNMTGLSTIIDGIDYKDQMRIVFERGMEFSKAHKLTPQVEISSELASQIHEDMVLAQEVEVRGTKVIIPRLYLGDAKRGVNARGIVASHVDLKAGKIVNDSDIIGSTVSLEAADGGIKNVGGGLIQGDKHLGIRTSGDVVNIGSKIESSGTASIEAKNLYNITEKSSKSIGSSRWEEIGKKAEVSSVSDMLIKTKGDVVNVGAKMLADHLGLEVGGDMYSGSVALTSSSESGNGNIHTKTQSCVYIPTTIQTSKGTTAFVAGDFTMVGSSMRSKGSNKLDIGGNLHVESQIAGDYSESISRSVKRGNRLRGKRSKTITTSTIKENIHTSQIEAGGENVITTAGDQQYIGAEIKSSAGTRISASQARLKALMTEDSSSTVSSYKNRVIQKQHSHGHANTTANSTQISGDVEFDTQRGVNIEYGSAARVKSKLFGRLVSNARNEEASLAARPEWMRKLDGDGQVSFSTVTQQNNSWNKKQQSLTPEASAVVSAGVTLGTFAMTGGLSSLTSGSILAAAKSSAVTAFSATRANQVINAAVSNRGNLKGTIKDSHNRKAFGTALKAGVQAGAISGITAGVTHVTGFGSMTEQVGGVEVAKSGASRYTALAARGLVEGGATSLVTGQRLDKSLEQSMGSSLLAMGQMAVGDIAASSGMADGSAAKIGMHAAVGGIYSSAKGGKFATGALGGAAGEVLGSNIDANDKAGGAKVHFATTVGGFLAGANAKDMQMAANVASSGFEYNRRLHASELSVLEKLKEGKTPEEQDRFDKAAKYLVKASAGVNENDPQYASLRAHEIEGASYVSEQKQLQDFAQALHEKNRYARDMELYLAVETRGVMGDTSKYKQRVFDYTFGDKYIDDPLSNKEEFFGRTRGGVQMAGGALGTVGAYTAAASITAETGGLGTMQALALAGIGGESYKYSQEGAEKLFGSYSYTEGRAVGESFGQPNESTYSGQLVKNTAIDVSTALGIAKVSNLAIKGAVAAENAMVARNIAPTATKPMTGGTGNNSPGVQINTTNSPQKVDFSINQTILNSKDQPWTVRSGQEYKLKVFGKGQKSTPGHSIRSIREGVAAAKDVNTEAVYLNQGINKVTGAKKGDPHYIKPNRRPDVTIKKKDGTIDQIEVPSAGDDIDALLQRMDNTRSKLPKNMRGEIDIKEITKGEGK